MAVEKKNLFWFIIIRLIVVTSILVSSIIIRFSTSGFLPEHAFYYLIILAYLLSGVYFVLYLGGRFYNLQAYFQICGDLLLITAFVYISGGANGSLYFLYVFSIITASIIISGRAAYLTAALSAILFGLLIDGLYFRIIPYFSSDYPADLSFGSVLFTIFIAWGVFFVIALLMNSLTENLRRTAEKLRLAQKELDIKERLAAAGQVAANLAHEIRNPLAAVAGSVQVLKSELRLTNDQKNLMNIILRESERASQSIEQFLDLASPGKQVFSSINLSEVLKETLTVLKAGGELDSQYDVAGNYQSSQVRYYGNANQFKQIFWNLTKNAIKAMPRGGTLTIDFVSNGKRELAIRFADTGRGMSQESRQRLFEPFYSSFENGRGLGMAVVRRIVDDYEGKIQVSSEVDRGTTILITLPLRNRNHRS
jgi:two-component system sensor histidine kinase PilS (NtrC family)